MERLDGIRRSSAHHWLSQIMGVCLFPCWLCSCRQVSEREQHVLLYWGSYTHTLKLPGCYCVNVHGLDARVVSTQQIVIELAKVKVADHNGNPLVISGVVTYKIHEAHKWALSVTEGDMFVHAQGQSVLKAVAARYPYEARGSEHSLKSSHDMVSEELKSELQNRVDAAGVVVVSFELTDLSYAPEIAQAMLVRQQAEATVAARNTIVRGAVQITTSAVERLESQGVKLTRDEKAQLMGNILFTICGETHIQPVISLDMKIAKE